MKEFLKKSVGRVGRAVLRASGVLGGQFESPSGRDLDRQMQMLLAAEYRRCVAERCPLPAFSDAEFSSFSQNGEDGILHLLFSVLGTTNKIAVEACAGDGIECNAANLIVNHGWSGLLLDGDSASLQRGREFYANRASGWRLRRIPPRLVAAWITAENINDLIFSNGVSSEIDLLSIDLDGVDYWIWKSLSVIAPRVVVVEYNNRWSASQSVTVPYRPDFVGHEASDIGEGYFGASLLAFTKLAAEKGYRLVGSNSPNTNAFFFRKDLGTEWFPEVSVESCLSSEYAKAQHRDKYPLISGRPVHEV
jgi:hypothetical protein